MPITIEEAIIITGIVPKDEKPVKILTHKLNKGHSFRRKDFTGKPSLKLVAAADGSCFGELIRRDMDTKNSRPIDVPIGETESGLQFYTRDPHDPNIYPRYTVIKITVTE